MDERSRDGYFQPFRSAFEQGTGLGAAIVYRLVEEHGGRIDLESQPSRGTTIRIVVPQVRAGAEESKDASLATAGGVPA
jgi:signal transduction histidine kinase